MKAEDLDQLEKLVDACDHCQSSLGQWVPPVGDRHRYTTSDRNLFARIDRVQQELVSLVHVMDPMLEAMAITLKRR